MNQILFWSDQIAQRHGVSSLYRIPINLYLSCPHRMNGQGGCLFCAEDGATARHLRHTMNLKEQIQTGIQFASTRYHATPPYIAYFQSFTNTNAPVEKLRQLYSEALSHADFAAIVIATRPDALPPEVLDYLQELSQSYDLWVELGIQSACDTTLQLINRGHDWNCSVNAIHELAKRNIKTAVHLILGLPGETEEHFLYTAQQLKNLPITAIKFHQMMVLKKTGLSKLYREQPHLFHILNEYDYANALISILDQLPQEIEIMRLSADIEDESLIAPRWLMKKGQFKEFFLQRFYHRDQNEMISTQDGSLTAYHPSFRQHFHNLAGAETETRQRHLTPCEIENRLKNQNLNVLDIGFGLGYNALAVAESANSLQLHTANITSLEIDSQVLHLAKLAQHQQSLWREKIIDQLMLTAHWENEWANIQFISGDARQTIKSLHSNSYDAIFLDAFSPDVNLELWSYDFIRVLFNLLKPNGIISTYSTAFPVIGAFLRAGFQLAESAPLGSKKRGIIAIKGNLMIHHIPFREKDLQIAKKTLTGIVWRDQGLKQTIENIRQRRNQMVEKMKYRGIPKWLSKID